jgi:hypothetical protein
MLDSQRYRYSVRECLLAAKEASEPCYRKLRLSMASSWLSLARQEEATDNARVFWGSAERSNLIGSRLSLPLHKPWSRGTSTAALGGEERPA